MIKAILKIWDNKSASDGAKLLGCFLFLMIMFVVFVLQTIAFRYNLWVGTSKEINWLGAAGMSILLMTLHKTKIDDVNLIGAAAIWILATCGVLNVPLYTY